jgi:uncharacterized protein HemY
MPARNEADSLYREMLAMRQRLQGESHQEIAVALRYLGVFERDRGRYEQAESLLTHAYAVHLQINGPEPHHVASALTELALVCEQTGDTIHAKSSFIDALAVTRKHHRDEYVTV